METFLQLRLTLLEQTLAWLGRVGSRKDTLPAHLRTGKAGEDAAFFYLRRNGYVMVARRWSCGERPGDIDLIAWDGPVLCFVEVKTRTAHDMTPAEAAVDGHKRRVLRGLAHQYIRQLPGERHPAVRFDVLSVYLVPGQPREFRHFPASFGWEDGGRDS